MPPWPAEAVRLSVFSSFYLKSLPTRLKSLPIRGSRCPFKKPFSRCFFGSLLLYDSCLVRLLAGHVRHHELPKLHELLNLLLVDLPHDLEGLHSSIGTLSHAAKGIQNRLFVLKLLPLEACGS